MECLFESPQLGQFSLTCSAIVESGGSPPKVVAKSIRKDKKDEEKNKTSQVLALGNCDGKILLYDIDSQFEGNRTNSAYFKFDNIIDPKHDKQLIFLSNRFIKLREKNWRMPT